MGLRWSSVERTVHVADFPPVQQLFQGAANEHFHGALSPAVLRATDADVSEEHWREYLAAKTPALMHRELAVRIVVLLFSSCRNEHAAVPGARCSVSPNF